MNKCNEEFIKRQKIDFSTLDSIVYNEIIEKYKIQGEKIRKEIPIEYI